MPRRKRLKPGTSPTAKPKAAVSLAPAPSWDMGATGPANRVGLVVEPRGEIDPATGKQVNPNGVKGARRVDMLEVWRNRGVITQSGFAAAEALRNAFEATQRAPGWPDNERVQSSPKPDHAVTIQIERLSRYHDLARRVAVQDRAIIAACVLYPGIPARLPQYRGRRYAEGLAHLRAALDRLANVRGY